MKSQVRTLNKDERVLRDRAVKSLSRMAVQTLIAGFLTSALGYFFLFDLWENEWGMEFFVEAIYAPLVITFGLVYSLVLAAKPRIGNVYWTTGVVIVLACVLLPFVMLAWSTWYRGDPPVSFDDLLSRILPEAWFVFWFTFPVPLFARFSVAVGLTLHYLKWKGRYQSTDQVR